MAPAGESGPLSAQEVHKLCYSVMNDNQRKVFEQTMELNMGLRVRDLGRFRIKEDRRRASGSGVGGCGLRRAPERVPADLSLSAH